MKRIMAAVLVLMLVFCAQAEETVAYKLGLLSLMGVDGDEWTAIIQNHMEEEHDIFVNTMENAAYYNSLDEMLSALEAGEVDAFSVNECIANYIVNRNENYALARNAGGGLAGFAMMGLQQNAAVLEQVNGAIAAIRADGVLNSLAEEHIFACADGKAPEKTEIPSFEGAQTIRVAVTGELPPIDYIGEDGVPAGFSAALAAEIAARTQLNFEFVKVKNEERAAALTSGAADLLFWVRTMGCNVEGCPGIYLEEAVEGAETEITDVYFEGNLAAIVKK